MTPAVAEREGALTSAPPAVTETVSVIVPVTERPERLPELYREFAGALRDAGYTFQFVCVAGPSYRKLLDPLIPLARQGEPLLMLEAAQDVGEATLLRSALGYCTGSIIVTLPAYRRIDASGLVMLVQRVAAGAHIVVARRLSEHDPWTNRIQRRVVHALVRHGIGGNFHDLGSGVRAMRPEVLQQVPLYGEYSRFLPLLASREGFAAEELAVPQHAADQRRRIYSPGIYLRRLIDLTGLFFLIKFREKPLRFFGLFGSAFTLVGGVMLAILAVQRFYGRALADRPLLLLSVLLLVVGLQAIALGLVGEIIVHISARHNPSYRLSRRA